MSFWNEPSRSDYVDGKIENHFNSRCAYKRYDRGNGEYLLQQKCWCNQCKTDGEEIHYSINCAWVKEGSHVSWKGNTVYVLRKDCYCGGRRPNNAPYLPWNQTSRRW